MDHTSINQIIVDIMVIFMVLGAVDKCLNNKFGLGAQFEEGINALGSLALSMVGIVSLAPVLGSVLTPIVGPLYQMLGADPAMFATTLLACDMGGYPLAQEMALTAEAGDFAGIILGSMMGATIVFSIPVALGIIDTRDQGALATGTLAGIIAIPFGCFVGGLLAGYSVGMIIMNLIPIILVAVLIALGLIFIPSGMIKGFTVFGKFIVIVSTVGFALAIVEALTGIVIIPGMAPVTDGISTVGSIAIVLAGAYPMVTVITKVFRKPLMKVGSLLGMNDVAAAGLIATLANNIPMFGMMKDMDERGKIINVAFSVCAAFVFGDHLGFTAGVAQHMLTPMIVGKLIGGLIAIVIAVLICNKRLGKKAAA